MSATTITITLNNGLPIPVLGLGVYRAEPKDAYTAVLAALKHGYRHIDTAALYGNERDVGRAVRDSGIPRSQIWITTKLWIDQAKGNGATLRAFEESLKKLDIGYIDLYLIHAPVVGTRLDAWKEMEEIYKSGKAKAIGVSNYGIDHLTELLEKCTITPAVNQIEVHPFLQRTDLCAFCKSKGIVVQAYSPLTKARKLGDPTVVRIAENLDKTPAQILIRWGIQMGYVTLPKTTTMSRISENASVFDWSIPKEDMDALDALENAMTTGWDPTEWD
ncbi:hypothetical protein HDU76_009362 [Blyttiomyces sp. JEL0837]|nr:hypothetical protein HDU76_009362 [Blyttiomyces sp. JEL0837]